MAGLLNGVVGHLPAASNLVPISVPSVFTDAAALVGQLDRYVPIHEMVAVIGLALLIQGGMMLFFVASWIYQRIPFKAT